MPYELQPEAMRNATHAMTSSEYRSGLETVRAHVNAMCTHVVAHCLHLRFEVENESVAGKAPLGAATANARGVCHHAYYFLPEK